MKVYNHSKSQLLGYHVYDEAPTFSGANLKPMSLSIRGFLLHLAIAMPIAAILLGTMVAWALFAG